MLNILSKTTTELPLQTVNINSCVQAEQISRQVKGLSCYITSITDKGCNKEANEDGILIKSGDTALGHSVFIAVADGVGGLAHGAEASKIAIDGLEVWWNITLKTLIYSNVENMYYLINESLSAALQNINSTVYERGIEDGEKMGTTLSVIFLINNWYCIKHAGDSRIYLVSKKLRQLTEDHNLLSQYLRTGALDEIRCGYRALNNVLTKCIGIKPEIELFEQTGEISDTEGILLCTDGLYKMLSVTEINRSIIGWCRTMETMQQGLLFLVEKVRKRGERDDVSAVVMFKRMPKKKWRFMFEGIGGR